MSVKFKIKNNIQLDKVVKDFVKNGMPKTMEKIAEFSAEDTREFVNSGVLHDTQPLSDLTIDKRDNGVFYEGKMRVRFFNNVKSVTFPPTRTGIINTGGVLPLRYSGKLVNSLKGSKFKENKTTLKGVDYALEHHRGYSVDKHEVKWEVPARKFLQLKPNMNKVMKVVEKEVNKSIKKNK
tara:strand:+ start:1094 stop:1633 length:540 start_codon:yes stop_codon:yes gene_type:complete